MKKTYLTVFLFFLCNAIGFTVGPLVFVLANKYKLIDIHAPDINTAMLQYDMITAPIFMWLPCALFSFAVFFLTGIWRKFFFLAPIAAPLIYSLITLQNY